MNVHEYRWRFCKVEEGSVQNYRLPAASTGMILSSDVCDDTATWSDGPVTGEENSWGPRINAYAVYSAHV